MKWQDVSMRIHPSMMVYKNKDEKKPKLQTSATFEKNGVYETDLTMNLHTGTHIDFPKHSLENGQTSNGFDPATMIRKVKVFDLTNVYKAITKEDIELFTIGEDDFLIFKTRNSYDQEFNFEFVYLAQDAAEYLSNKKIAGVGIDGLGIERNQEGHPTHKTLLKQGIIILEGLQLQEIAHGLYDMICLPLKIDDVEALPVRALLKRIDKKTV